MNKYVIYRRPDEDDENYDQHELIGVEYGEDIFDATSRLIEAVREDLAGCPEYAECEILAYPPEEMGEMLHYPYEMTGVVFPPVAEKNILVWYGIIETDGD